MRRGSRPDSRFVGARRLGARCLGRLFCSSAQDFGVCTCCRVRSCGGNERAGIKTAGFAVGGGADRGHGIGGREMKWPRPHLDGRRRRRCPGTRPGIKDEGWSIEGD